MSTFLRLFAAAFVASSLLLGAYAETVEICAAPLAARPLDTQQFDQLRGRYAMADGSVLRIGGTRRHPVAVIDDAAPVMLHTTANASLVSDDGRVRIDFHRRPDGDAESLTLSRTRI